MVASAALGEITVRKLLPLLLVLSVATTSQALAQQVKLPANTERMTLSNLRHYMLGDDGKSVSPHSSVADDDEAPFSIDPATGLMLGNPYTQGCVNLWTTGEGRMTYNLKGGTLRHAASCENIGVTDYEWTTTVTLSPGRITLNGEARTVAPCLQSEPNCALRAKLVATEKAVIRVEGRRCFVESYNFKTSETTGNPYLKGVVNSFVTFSTAKSRCELVQYN
jgi:hypothetical protein